MNLQANQIQEAFLQNLYFTTCSLIAILNQCYDYLYHLVNIFFLNLFQSENYYFVHLTYLLFSQALYQSHPKVIVNLYQNRHLRFIVLPNQKLSFLYLHFTGRIISPLVNYFKIQHFFYGYWYLGFLCLTSYQRCNSMSSDQKSQCIVSAGLLLDYFICSSFSASLEIVLSLDLKCILLIFNDLFKSYEALAIL